MRSIVFYSVVCLVFVLSVHQPVIACSCIRSSPVDVSFEKTPTVAVFKLRSVEKYPEQEREHFSVGGIKFARLTVEKVYKGNLKVGQELKFRQGGGGDCVFVFAEERIGSEYLFYLGSAAEKSGVWIAGTCSRSASKDFAGADLLYLDKIAAVLGKTRLSGTLSQWRQSVVGGREFSHTLLAGRKVTITGNGKTFELTTDADGVYEIYDLPAGKYTVKPERIAGYKIGYIGRRESTEVEILPGKHAEAVFEYSIDNRVSGRFFDKNGTPLKNVGLELRPADGTKRDGYLGWDYTEADGRFEIENVPEGSYVLVINESGRISSSQPFGTFYYPSTKKREEAAILNIAPGVYLEDLIVNAPETAEVITVSGVLVLEDGKRATDKNTEHVSVEFHADETRAERAPARISEPEPDARAEIDKEGRFTIRILKGQKGRLFATMMSYEGKYVNCPKIDKLIRQNPKDSTPTIKSTVFLTDAAADFPDAILKFPFPSCRLAKVD